MRTDLPRGTVTFLFTDVEGSTKLLHELGAEGYAAALAEHRRVIRDACAAQGGVEVDTQGDAFFFAFPTAPGALAAARAMTEALASGPIKVRMGLHTGTPLLTDEGYVGGDVHRAARIAAAGHGGQVLVSSSTAQLAETQLVDLGEHRLKDLSAPERIFQLRDARFPPLKSLYRTNLPVSTTPFLGRERELAEVVGLLERTRLLTLTGAGGTGKTRLALQAAAMAADGYPDGVYWVPLAALRDADLVLPSAAQALGARDGVADHISDKRLLVLFDNFEQVAEAAPGLAEVRASCPNLDLLVTSREPLRISGEQEYAVPPLVHEESVGFFLARARAVKADFQSDDAVSEICRRLDDLPLALELAAARVKALTTAQLLERLDERLPLLTGGARDLPERQRTLRGAIAWSYELLSEREQTLFARLAVFAGGCTLGAAEEVAGADLDTLQSLVDKSLLRFGDDRYWMLETIREYATERLEEAGEQDSLLERLAGYLIDLAETEGAPLFLGRQPAALARLAPEHPNVRGVVAWALDTQRYKVVIALTTLLWLVWSDHGHAAEALNWVNVAFADSGELSPEVGLPALIGAGEVARFAGDLPRAIVFKEQSLQLLPRYEAAEPWWEPGTLADLADIAMEQGDLVRAWALAERSLELRRDRGLSPERTLGSLGEIALRQGDLDRAEELLELAMEGYREAGHEINIVSSLISLGATTYLRGESDRASALFVEALERSSGLGMEAAVPECLQGLALVEYKRGDLERAARLWGAGKALEERLGSQPLSVSGGVNDLPERARAEGAAMSLDEAVAYALADADA